MKTFIKVLINISRILIGLVFIFSGYVKGVDPLGSAYKFTDYFNVVNIHPADGITFVLSIMLSAAEFIIGVALLLGLVMRFTAWVALCFMTFFTILTFFLAVFNPVTDCGCFGDAIKLTNWQTFYKNLIFMVLIINIFAYRKNFKNSINLVLQWSITALASVLFVVFSVYCYKHLPAVDFMPYSVGSSIPEKMARPAGAPSDVFETKLYYQKNGETKEFTTDNYPWQDSTWKWVDTKSVLVKKGYTPPIHDFVISKANGDNVTDSILADTTYSFIFVAYNLNKANLKGMQKAEELYRYSLNSGKCKFYAVTASTTQDIKSFQEKSGITYPFYSADETALKTMVRANPGLMLLKNGVIIGKWHYNDFDKIDLNRSNFLSQEIEKNRVKSENLLTLCLFLSLAFIITLMVFLFKKNH